jgi:hypothetical protein
LSLVSCKWTCSLGTLWPVDVMKALTGHFKRLHCVILKTVLGMHDPRISLFGTKNHEMRGKNLSMLTGIVVGKW